MYMYMYISLYKEFKLVCKNILSNVESITNKLEQEKQTKVKTKRKISTNVFHLSYNDTDIVLCILGLDSSLILLIWGRDMYNIEMKEDLL